MWKSLKVKLFAMDLSFCQVITWWFYCSISPRKLQHTPNSKKNLRTYVVHESWMMAKFTSSGQISHPMRITIANLCWNSEQSYTLMTPVSQTTRHRGVGDHAAGTHDLGQIATRHDGRWLIVDAALEASGAPGLNVTQAARGKKFAAWNCWECTVVVW